MIPQYLKPSFSERMAAAKDAHKANGTSGGKVYSRAVTAGDYAPVEKRLEPLLLNVERLKWKCREIIEHAEWIIAGSPPHEYIPF